MLTPTHISDPHISTHLLVRMPKSSTVLAFTAATVLNPALASAGPNRSSFSECSMALSSASGDGVIGGSIVCVCVRARGGVTVVVMVIVLLLIVRGVW